MGLFKLLSFPVSGPVSSRSNVSVSRTAPPVSLATAVTVMLSTAAGLWLPAGSVARTRTQDCSNTVSVGLP